MNSKEFEKITKAMEEFLKPEAQEKRLTDKWRDAGEACALHFHLDPPAPDGNFEILLVPRRDIEDTLKIFKKDRIDIISFAAGVALAQQPDCSGGWHTVQEAKKIIEINEDAKAQTISLDL